MDSVSPYERSGFIVRHVERVAGHVTRGEASDIIVRSFGNPVSTFLISSNVAKPHLQERTRARGARSAPSVGRLEPILTCIDRAKQ